MHINRLSVLLIVVFVVHCTAAPTGSDRHMPVEIDGVSLGMGWRDFLALGRNVQVYDVMPEKPTDLQPNPERPQRGLIEELEEGPYDRVVYGFQNGVLTSVMLGGEAKVLRGNRDAFLRKLMSKYGNPRRMTASHNQLKHGVLDWSLDDVKVRAVLPSKGQDGFISLQIMKPEVAQMIESEEKLHLIQMSASDRKDADAVKSALASDVQAVLAELQETRPGQGK